MPFRLDITRDVVMGHDFAAEVIDFGTDAGTITSGTPVSHAARDGCNGVRRRLLARLPGGYASDGPAALFLFRCDASGIEHASLTEPLAVGVHAVANARPAGRRASRRGADRGLASWPRSASRRGADRGCDYSLMHDRCPSAWGAHIVSILRARPFRRGEAAGSRPHLFWRRRAGAADSHAGAPRASRIIVAGVYMETTASADARHQHELRAVRPRYTPLESPRRHDIAEAHALAHGTGGSGSRLGGPFEASARPESHAKILANLSLSPEGEMAVDNKRFEKASPRVARSGRGLLGRGHRRGDDFTSPLQDRARVLLCATDASGTAAEDA